MPKPPLMSKEQSDKWDKREDNYYKYMAIGVMVCGFLFMILVGLIAYLKFFK